MGVGLLADDAMRFARVRLGVVLGHVSAILRPCRIERGTSGDRLQRQLLECTTVSGCNYAGKRDEERQQSGDPLPTTSPEVGSHGNPMIPRVRAIANDPGQHYVAQSRGLLVGIVTLGDLLRIVVAQIDDLVGATSGELVAEARERP